MLRDCSPLPQILNYVERQVLKRVVSLAVNRVPTDLRGKTRRLWSDSLSD